MNLSRALRVLLFSVALVAATALPARAAGPAMRRIALLVGANDPPPGRSALRFAHDDATNLSDVLQRVGGFAPGDVHLLLDPRPAELLATFDSVAQSSASSGGDVLFVFYYSGHSDGQSLFPHGERMALADLRARVERLGARIRIGILDTCRGGSWTQSKGLTVGPPLSVADLMNVDTEGTALVSSSSGLENAHEASDVHGSFFTHYFTAGLRGAADRAGDGNVTLEEAFDYAKERTVRESARLAKTPQHPSFDLALRGRQDIVLTVLAADTSAVQITTTRAPVEVIHLPSGVTVADAQAGQGTVRIAVPPGRYLVRSVVDGKVLAKEIEVHAGETATLAEAQLEATGSEQLAMKGGDEKKAASSDEDDDDSSDDEDDKGHEHSIGIAIGSKRERERGHENNRDEKFHLPRCNGTDGDEAFRVSTACSGDLAVRGSIVSATGGASTQRQTGLEISLHGEDFWQRRLYSTTGAYRAAIGGGGAGFEGTLFGSGSFGLRLPVTADQGPIVRAGGVLYMMGNDAIYSSLIELPQTMAGWQWSHGHALVEAAGTLGVALTGRFRSDTAITREIGSGFAYGGRLSVQIPWVHASAIAERLPGNDGISTPIDMAMGSLCLQASPVAICGDAMLEQSKAHLFGDPTTEVTAKAAYGGVSIGLTSGW
jgi:hypothetical protein